MRSHLDELISRCGCCTGRGAGFAGLPRPVNRPGLTAIEYRIGNHGAFKAAMLAALAGDTPLGDLGTRDDEDFTIALLDAWATVLDVLTFYQERIANEGFLRTAVERRSIRELARMIGYELRPGVAASGPLAFTLDSGPGTPAEVRIERGTRAQSLPAKNELPQPFETSSNLLARPQWNRLTPRQTGEQLLKATLSSVWVKGTAASLKVGDPMLIVTAGMPTLRVVAAVEIEAAAGRTRVDFEALPDGEPPQSVIAAPPPPLAARRRDAATTASEPRHGDKATRASRELAALTRDFRSAGRLGSELDVLARRRYWTRQQLRDAIVGLRRSSTSTSTPSTLFTATATTKLAGDLTTAASDTALYALRIVTAPFGHNAPLYKTTPAAWRPESGGGDAPASDAAYPHNWDPEWPIDKQAFDDTSRGAVLLAQPSREVTEGSWVVLQSGISQAFLAVEPREVTVADFGLTGRSTRLRLADPATGDEVDYTQLGKDFKVRDTAIYAVSEALPLAELTLGDILGQVTSELEVEQPVPDLPQRRRLILRGELVEPAGVVEHEELELEEVVQGIYSNLRFTLPIQNSYRRDTVEIYANVVGATHGETRKEVLGSGDASLAFQRFTLRQPPLTYTSAPVASGGESTLELRVGGVRWHEAPGFFGLGPPDRRYVLRRDEEGNTQVLFGDGRHGARLPTGSENVSAVYRSGIGRPGQVEAGRITLLNTRPLGVQAVVNPLPAGGAEDPETRDRARRNAPVTVLTLDRVVATSDFEDFARAFSGIGKAQARRLAAGKRSLVHLTVTGSEGDEPSPEVTRNLLQALDAARAPHQAIQVDEHQALFFKVVANVRIHADHRGEEVLAAVTAALSEAFSFARRDFAQRVAISEVLATIQKVAGVVAATLDDLTYIGGSGGNVADAIGLPARAARYNADLGAVEPAQLLLIAAEHIEVQEDFS